MVFKERVVVTNCTRPNAAKLRTSGVESSTKCGSLMRSVNKTQQSIRHQLTGQHRSPTPSTTFDGGTQADGLFSASKTLWLGKQLLGQSVTCCWLRQRTSSQGTADVLTAGHNVSYKSTYTNQCTASD